MPFCRECGIEISKETKFCPICSAPNPANQKWNGYGFEYKSKFEIFSLPLIHISFKYNKNRFPVPAKGIIAIGQFAIGFICISQFGLGFFCLSQLAVGAYIIAQVGIAVSLIAQFGIYITQGYGMILIDLKELINKLIISL